MKTNVKLDETQSKSGAAALRPSNSPSSSELSTSPIIDFKRPPSIEFGFLLSLGISMPNQIRPMLSKYTE